MVAGSQGVAGSPDWMYEDTNWTENPPLNALDFRFVKVEVKGPVPMFFIPVFDVLKWRTGPNASSQPRFVSTDVRARSDCPISAMACCRILPMRTWTRAARRSSTPLLGSRTHSTSCRGNCIR